MTKEDIFKHAIYHYNIRKKKHYYLDNFPSFTLKDLPDDRISHIIVHVKNDDIKEVVVHYKNDDWETLRANTNTGSSVTTV